MQTMRLVLVLPLRNQAALEAFLKELYDPSSASYRHYLTVEEFTAKYGPSQEDYDAVIRFAEANGLTVVGTSRNRVNVDVTGSVANIEKAFHRSEEHTSELQSRLHLVCRLLLEKKKPSSTSPTGSPGTGARSPTRSWRAWAPATSLAA